MSYFTTSGVAKYDGEKSPERKKNRGIRSFPNGTRLADAISAICSSDTVEENQMNTTLVRLLLSCAAAGALAAGPIALAQAPAPPAPATAAGPPPPPMAAAPPPPPGTYNPAQLPQTQGTVQRFTLTPIGEIDGVILADGTEVHLPPHLTAEIAAAVRIGDRVIVRGYRSPYLPLVVAASITDT